MSAMETHEHAEHAEHAAHAHDPLITRISITIAILAVAAAIATSLEAVESSGAIIEANKAVLSQDKATDAWNFYQAKSIKKNMFQVAASVPGAAAAGWAKKAADEGADQTKAQTDAKAAEHERDTALAASEVHEKRHHWLTAGAAMIEIGIAVSTIAIITRRRSAWLGAAALGIVGAGVAALAFIL